ncbi:MAG TPA: choice-of-anchor Q domain-containing protein [Candidatus Sulfotelmatobacter sp.]|nr:choice-of-anchor Q domain-containing protein [Candidatus Sulfotelmatobacter sp.]
MQNFALLLALLFLTQPFHSVAQAAPPRIFFSDLESGPNTGGKNNHGVWVTIWGKGFGTERRSSTVTVGGGAAADYPIWTDAKITFQLGAAARSGNIVVNGANSTSSNPSSGISGAKASNGLPFTVRPGKIFFVATNGSDRNNGSVAAPWRTIVHAKDRMSAGDVTYIGNGVTQSKEDSYTAFLSMDRDGGSNSGKPGAPKALVAYPGAAVTIGVAHGLEYGIRTPNIHAREDHWVISQLHIIGGRQAIDMGGTGWKIVGNEIECPGADGQVGCVETSQASQIRFYGNEVHNAGTSPASSKFYHAVYFSTDSNHIDVGWNHIHDNFTCRAVQFHSSPLCSPGCGASDETGHNQYDLHVHDNLIHGDNCNAINFATVDPSKGPVEAYNNVIYHVGVHDPLEGGGAFSCIYVAGITNHGRAGTGTVEIFNNTLYDCAANNSRNADGSRGAFSVGGGPPGLMMRLRNNVVYQLPGELYLDGSKSQITGERNLWFGSGTGPQQTASNLNADPQFMNLAGFDFHLRAGSPAGEAGTAATPKSPLVVNPAQATDKDGVARPQGKAFSLGAYEIQR